MRHAKAIWEGDVKTGEGILETGSGAFKGGYTFTSRFEDGEAPLTNPEELLGAAHAGCFSMALAEALGDAGYTDNQVYTYATVTLDKNGDFHISRIELDTDVYVPEMSDEAFLDCVETAKEACLVSQALVAVDVDIRVERVDSPDQF